MKRNAVRVRSSDWLAAATESLGLLPADTTSGAQSAVRSGDWVFVLQTSFTRKPFGFAPKQAVPTSLNGRHRPKDSRRGGMLTMKLSGRRETTKQTTNNKTPEAPFAPATGYVTAEGGKTYEMKKTAEEVAAEVAKLKKIKPHVRTHSAFCDDNHAAIDAQIDAMERHYDHDDCYDAFDENDHARDSALFAVDWLTGKSDPSDGSPSEQWEGMVQ